MMPLRDTVKNDCKIEVYEDGSIRIYKPDYPNAVLITPKDDARAELHRFMAWDGPTP